MACKTSEGRYRKNMTKDGRKNPKTKEGKIVQKELRPAFKEIDETLKSVE